ncbi:ferredoxin reductase-like C-terminal NADP-linked domain-containing protein [Abortiporus biennis]|nr:ferredoxin reductase-like C-terminal NADP-linked domain-containing protein [Abortiporus biennis]
MSLLWSPARHALSRSRPSSIALKRAFSQPPHGPAARTNSSLYLKAALGAAATTAVSAYFLWPSPSRSAPTCNNSQLSPTYFTPVTVVSSEACQDPHTKLITLSIPPHALPDRDSLKSIWSIFIKDDDIQVERPYTPLEGIDSQGKMTFWIKKYPRGEVGRWLHSKQEGDTIEIRGPLMTWPWQGDKWDEVIMISGGTGITPFYQLIHQELLENTKDTPSTRFTLVHSSRTPRELPPPQILRPLIDRAHKDPRHFRLHLFVDKLDESVSESVSSDKLSVGYISKDAILNSLGLSQNRSWWKKAFSSTSVNAATLGDRRVLFLICGPEPMIAAIAGPYGRNLSQGSIGGTLGELGFDSSQVYKL